MLSLCKELLRIHASRNMYFFYGPLFNKQLCHRDGSAYGTRRNYESSRNEAVTCLITDQGLRQLTAEEICPLATECKNIVMEKIKPSSPTDNKQVLLFLIKPYTILLGAISYF